MVTRPRARYLAWGHRRVRLATARAPAGAAGAVELLRPRFSRFRRSSQRRSTEVASAHRCEMSRTPGRQIEGFESGADGAMSGVAGHHVRFERVRGGRDREVYSIGPLILRQQVVLVCPELVGTLRVHSRPGSWRPWGSQGRGGTATLLAQRRRNRACHKTVYPEMSGEATSALLIAVPAAI